MKNFIRKKQTKYTGGVLREKYNQFKIQWSNKCKREKQGGEKKPAPQSNKIRIEEGFNF